MDLLLNQESVIPDGWTAATSDKLLLGEAEGWKRCDKSLDNVLSRFHE